MEATPPKEPAEHQGEEKTIGVNDEAKVHGDLKNGEAKKVKKEDDDDKEEDKTTDDVTKSFQHLEVTSDDLGLIFEKALQEALDNPRPSSLPQSHRLPDWPPAVEASQQHLIHGMTQQNFLDKLKVNREAKDRFNRRCKKDRGIQTPETETGNRGKKQAKHPRRVAVPEAVEVYNEILKYYLKNGKMPQ